MTSRQRRSGWGVAHGDWGASSGPRARQWNEPFDAYRARLIIEADAERRYRYGTFICVSTQIDPKTGIKLGPGFTAKRRHPKVNDRRLA